MNLFVYDSLDTKELVITNNEYVNQIRFLRTGNVCNVYFTGIKQNLSKGTKYKLCNIPEEYKPKYLVIKSIIFDESSIQTYLYIDTEGVHIKPKSDVTTTSNIIYVSETYIGR